MINHRVCVNPQRACIATLKIDYSLGYPEPHILQSVPAGVYLFTDYPSIYFPDIGFPLKNIIHSPDLSTYEKRLTQVLDDYPRHLENTEIYNLRLAEHGNLDGYPLMYTTREIPAGQALHLPKGLSYWTVELWKQSTVDQVRVGYPIIKSKLRAYPKSSTFDEYLRTVDYHIHHPHGLPLKELLNSVQFI